MKWPWVSRHALEVSERYATFLENSLSAEKARNDGLQERLLSLKMTGAIEAPRPRFDPERPFIVQPTQQDELRDLIDQRSAGNLRIRGMMLKQLQQDRADGMQEDEIRQRILDGVQSEGLPS